ncbi:MAG TPA: hypothetical protein VGD27_17225 [Longimicrobiales bacterium]
MSHRFKLAAALAAALLVPVVAEAQDIAGKWTAEYPRSVRNINGVTEAGEMGTALLTIEVRGDSIFGTWQVQHAPNPSPPRKFSGTYSNGKIAFTAEPSETRIRRSMGGGGDNESTMKIIIRYEGTLKDGVIEGTFIGESEDQTVRMPPVKWTAKRLVN